MKEVVSGFDVGTLGGDPAPRSVVFYKDTDWQRVRAALGQMTDEEVERLIYGPAELVPLQPPSE